MLWGLMLKWAAKCRCNCGYFKVSNPRHERTEPRHDVDAGLGYPHVVPAGSLGLNYKLTHMYYTPVCFLPIMLDDL